MEKLILVIRGYTACFWWVVQEMIKWTLEEYPDLKFWKRHTNLDDHVWYAERVNGRIAMLALTVVLLYEFTTHTSIWSLVNGIKYHTILS